MPVRMEVLFEDTLRRLAYDGKMEEAWLRMSSATGNPQQLLTVFEDLVENKLDDVLGSTPPHAKNAESSARVRLLGNKMFLAKKYKDAAELYSRAVARAPEGSRHIALAYGNRSAVLVRMNEYEIAYEDTKRALDLISEDDVLVAKLIDRQWRCLMYKQTGPKILRMPFKKIERYNPTIPCASAALKLTVDSEFGGRCIFAKEMILPGQLLAIEQPYILGLYESHFQKHCFECGDSCFSLIPCKGCRYAMFCSLSCAEKAIPIHQYECSLMHFLVEMRFTQVELRALRTVIKAKSDAGTWTALKKVVKRVNAQTNLATKGFVAVGIKKIYDSTHYESVHALVTNESELNTRELLKGCLATTVLVFLLDKHSNFYDDADSEEKNFSGGLILHHYMTAIMNERSIPVQHQVDDYKKLYQPEVFAFGVYPFLSLFNHSCAPNVCQVRMGNSIALVALRLIAKGKQVFDNYGPHYVMRGRDDRRYELLHRYKFNCNCEACSGDWPIFNDLPNASLSDSVIKKMKRILLDETKVGYYLNISLYDAYKCVQIFEKYAPCKELVHFQHNMIMIWVLIIDREFKDEQLQFFFKFSVV